MTRTNPLHIGAHFQPYLESGGFPSFAEHPAAHMAAVDAKLGEWSDLGGVGFIVHGFVGGMTHARYLGYAALGEKHALQVSAAWGLGEHDSTTPEHVADWIAPIANDPRCAATVFDGEKAWRNAPTDRAAANTLMVRTRANAPDAYLVGQFAAVLQTSDPEYRNMGRIEFVTHLDALASMDYFNYAPFAADRMDKVDGWRKKHATLGADLGVPQTWVTLATHQSYRYDHIEHEGVELLLTTPNDVVFVWGEGEPGHPHPDAGFKAMMKAIRDGGHDHVRSLQALAAQDYDVPDYAYALVAHGYTGPRAVKRFQEEHGLVADRIVGKRTRAALGL